jgi:hypothetical protein
MKETNLCLHTTVSASPPMGMGTFDSESSSDESSSLRPVSVSLSELLSEKLYSFKVCIRRVSSKSLSIPFTKSSKSPIPSDGVLPSSLFEEALFDDCSHSTVISSSLQTSSSSWFRNSVIVSSLVRGTLSTISSTALFRLLLDSRDKDEPCLSTLDEMFVRLEPVTAVWKDALDVRSLVSIETALRG